MGSEHSAWDDLIVVCSGTSWDGVWFPDKHIASRLVAYAPVLFVDPPTSALEERGRPRLELLGPRLARLRPRALPGFTRPLLRAATEPLTRRAMRRAVGELHGSVRALVVANQFDLLDACPAQRRVLYATDDLRAGAGILGVSAEQLERGERRLAQSADLVIACSEHLAEKWRRLGHDALLIPNGCDAAMYATTDDAPWPADVGLPRPIAGFVGHLSDRIDVDLLVAVADAGCSLLLVGPRQPTFDLRRLDDLLRRPNVAWVGAKAFEELPSYMRAIDVGLTPYHDDTFNRASFPLKTLEYLAAGRAAVSSDLPATRWLQTDLVEVASGPDAYVAAVCRALARERTAADVAARRFAEDHDWSVRAAQFAEALGLRVGVP